VGTIIVTGAASGTGAATAKLLTQQGTPVGCLDTDGPAVQKLADSLEHAAAVTPDIRHEEACFEAFARLGRLLGPISGTVHCAGIFDSHPVDTLQMTTLRHVLSVNVLGSLHVARSAARLIKDRGGRGHRACRRGVLHCLM
jgi:NAD(P)-dependent dehydrogenase (short-subunit alcohol dehydrogenase family)